MQKQIMLVTQSLVLAGAALWAQSAQQEFNRAMERLEGETITGSPYSAKAVTTSTQTLADGTHIARTIEALVARDSEGRTRREQGMNTVGPWSTNVKEHIVYIKDPAAQMRYVLQPDAQTAVKVSLGTVYYTTQSGDGTHIMFSKQEGSSQAEAEARVKVRQATEREIKAAAEAAAREGKPFIVGETERKSQAEDLGEQVIEGVKAQGRREKRTIAVGQIGNDRPIEISSEVWYSPEIKAVVLSKQSDPRVGESEYRLTNISRAEPPRTMFEVPPGYTVKEEGGRRK